MKKLTFLILFAFTMNFAKSLTIGGDSTYLEPGLRSRTDILFYCAFESTSWSDYWDFAANSGNTTMVGGGFDGNCLNVKLAANQYGATGSGTTSMYNLLKNYSGIQGDGLYEEMYLRYYVYLDPAFDFVQGGKLPGQMSHALYGAGRHPAGNDGWTSRYMWNSFGELYLYAYLPNASGWGTDIYCDYSGKRAALTKGRWHCIEQYVKLNTVTGSTGNKDGKNYTWLDGNLSCKLDDVLYRTVINDTGKEFGSYFACFFGGADAEWTHGSDTYMRFDNVVFATNYIGPKTGSGTLTTPVITTSGGTFTNRVHVSVTASTGDIIKFTTNGQEPNHWSPEYTVPITLVKNATLKVRAFNNSTPDYSGVATQTFIISTPAATTINTKNPSADSYIRDGNSYDNTNNGTATIMELKGISFGYQRRALLKFPISDVRVASAKLRLYVSSAATPVTMIVMQTASGWTETGLTWNNAPSAGDLLTTVNIAAAGWQEIDVSNYVSSLKSQGATEIAFFLMPQEAEKAISIASREAGSNKPELVIVAASSTGSNTRPLIVPSGLASPSAAGSSYGIDGRVISSSTARSYTGIIIRKTVDGRYVRLLSNVR